MLIIHIYIHILECMNVLDKKITCTVSFLTSFISFEILQKNQIISFQLDHMASVFHLKINFMLNYMLQIKCFKHFFAIQITYGFDLLCFFLESPMYFKYMGTYTSMAIFIAHSVHSNRYGVLIMNLIFDTLWWDLNLLEIIHWKNTV